MQFYQDLQNTALFLLYLELPPFNQLLDNLKFSLPEEFWVQSFL